MKRLKLAVLGLVLATSGVVNAAEFGKVEAAKSSISFSYKQMGVNMDGRFKKFTADIKFDPAKANAASATLDVDLNSIDVGSPDGNSEVGGKLWFNTKLFPTAKFTSTSVKPLGGDKYDVLGKLTIKGKTQDIVAPTTIKIQGNTAQFDGVFTLKRNDFAIGEGIWSDTSAVANEVPVKFHIITTSSK
ncbi:YceI family protein [Fluviibacter phosphoraccumulans]|mgnify:FL=1|uniref:Uncharacterized protein n=1 Tax=Fluviibacter phosphoraccumulans TaxID=1751046 RepID=A0A679IBY4_9RHOO|nr:YceI family protein [Fluviibacter phosphoraccumulans]BBU69240.1 hypothetical protein ICHIAU1_15230 [Fluviibacter phosphoraccumulans]BBU71604.1 hypothetical protein ICHIJ1_15230 [Fluviibacter phosphoraccumulans]BCA65175.1 hypothetical protein SHINM1_007770 [Fluviibacter phosphoraccumulans]